MDETIAGSAEQCRSWVFSGLIHPERERVEASVPTLKFSPDGRRWGHLRVTVKDSKCEIRMTGELDGIHVSTLRNQAQFVVQMIVDSLGWGNGCGYNVEITTVLVDGRLEDIRPYVPLLRNDPPEPPADAITILNLLFQDTDRKLLPLRRALADIRAAILNPEDTPFHCFRALEALCLYFFRRRDRGRKELCRRLRISDSWILQNLEKPAGEIRHGRMVEVSNEDREKAFHAVREVIIRFAEMIARKVGELPPPSSMN